MFLLMKVIHVFSDFLRRLSSEIVTQTLKHVFCIFNVLSTPIAVWTMAVFTVKIVKKFCVVSHKVVDETTNSCLLSIYISVCQTDFALSNLSLNIHWHEEVPKSNFF